MHAAVERLLGWVNNPFEWEAGPVHAGLVHTCGPTSLNRFRIRLIMVVVMIDSTWGLAYDLRAPVSFQDPTRWTACTWSSRSASNHQTMFLSAMRGNGSTNALLGPFRQLLHHVATCIALQLAMAQAAHFKPLLNRACWSRSWLVCHITWLILVSTPEGSVATSTKRVRRISNKLTKVVGKCFYK